MDNKNTETRDTNTSSKEAIKKLVVGLVVLIIALVAVAIYNKNSVKQVSTEAPVEISIEAETTEASDEAEVSVETTEQTQQDEQDEQMEPTKSFQSVSENSMSKVGKQQEKPVEVVDREENSNEYVIYTLALVIDPDNVTDNQRFRCVINKNEAGAKAGLVDIVVDSTTLPLIAPSGTEKTVEEYKADVKVNHYGEWLYTGKYYAVRFDEGEALDIKGTNVERFRAKSIGLATDADIENWKQGRALNSTFLADMEVIKKSEPLDIYDEICNEYQYTWTFEQIEAFRAYVESLDETNKNKWTSAAAELDLTLGY